MNYQKKLQISTNNYISFIDISAQVKQFIKESNVQNGIILVYTPHTTAGITINENADPSVMNDITNFISKRIPHEEYFKHYEGNSPSHIMSSLFSASETFIINNGEIILGQWQGIYFCEFDGPRTRNIFLKIIKS
jgi:secondary thiamine-phosphate synthase enzyme